MLNEYRKRRDAVHGWLTADPRFVCVKPGGAFYLFPYIADLLSPTGISSSGEFAEALLKEVAVAVTPGEGFDAPGFFRLSYATSIERLKEGCDRIKRFVQKLESSGKLTATLAVRTRIEAPVVMTRSLARTFWRDACSITRAIDVAHRAAEEVETVGGAAKQRAARSRVQRRGVPRLAATSCQQARPVGCRTSASPSLRSRRDAGTRS